MKKTIVFTVILLLPIMAAASEVMTSARQIGLGRVSAVVYYARNEQTVDFGSRGEYDLVTDAVVGKVSAKVWDKWHLFAKAGRIGADFQKGQDKYTNDKDYSANLVGVGIKYNLFPDTIVTPGISIDISAQQYKADLDKYNKIQDIDHTIKSTEFQGVLYISKKFFAFEPAVGLKVIRLSLIHISEPTRPY